MFVLTVAVTLVAVWAILDRWLRPWAAVAGTAVVMWFPATLGWMGHVGKDMWFAAAFFAAVALMGRAELTTRTAVRRSLLVAAVLAAGVLAVVGNTIRLEINGRRAEIEVTKLVGGSNAFVRRPFLYSGFWHGLGGGVLSVRGSF